MPRQRLPRTQQRLLSAQPKFQLKKNEAKADAGVAANSAKNTDKLIAEAKKKNPLFAVFQPTGE